MILQIADQDPTKIHGSGSETLSLVKPKQNTLTFKPQRNVLRGRIFLMFNDIYKDLF